MVKVFGTLGFTPGKFTVSLQTRGDVESVHVFHDREPRSLEAAQLVRDHCHELGIEVQTKDVDAFDIIACATEIQKALRAADRSNTVFNIAGGTKVLSSGAVLACILEGIPAVSVDDRTGAEVPLPLVEVPYRDLLGEQARKVLAHVAKNPGCGQKELESALGITKPTVSHHVTRLVQNGLLREGKHPEDGRRKTLHVIESAHLLLEDEAD